MRITGIEIDQFGVWQGFRQPLKRQGLTVFYGPNEAGKTTLLRFIRGVLYGFPPEDQSLPNKKRFQRENQAGVLRVEHQGRHFDLRRSGYGEGPGKLTIEGVSPGEATASVMEELLGSIDETLFESVFAVGLPELQQFATLAADQVGDHLYGMTLGPQGRVLMELPGRARHELQRLLGKDDGALIPQMLKRHEELVRQSGNTARQRERYHELLRKQEELTARVARHRKRQAELQSNLRGFSHLEKIHPVWARCRDLRHELERLPDFRAFPADGVARLERLDVEIGSAVRTRDALQAEIANLGDRLSQIRIDPEIRRFSGAIRILVEQRHVMQDIQPRMLELEAESRSLNSELATQLVDLGPHWSVVRLDAVHDTPQAHAQFVAASREYQATMTRTRRMQVRYRKVNAASRDRELALRTELQTHGVAPELLDESIDIAQTRLTQLTELGRWHAQAAQLEQQAQGVEHQLGRLNDRHGIPDWIFGILAWFTIAGFALFFGGLYSVFFTGWLVGFIFITLSLFAAGTSWAFRTHFERHLQEQVAELRRLRRDYETNRWNLVARIQVYIDQSGLRDWWGSQLTTADLGSGELLAEAARRTANLERSQRQFRQILQVRRRLSAFRGKLQLQQRELANARKQWCQTLRQLGYDETVDVEAAFRNWNRVIVARDLRRRYLAIQDRSRDIRHSYERFRKQVEELAHRMQRPHLNFDQPSQVVDLWEDELRKTRELLIERKRLNKLQVERRREAAEWSRKLGTLQRDHDALLKLAGVSQRSQLEQRLQLMERRRLAENHLDQSTRELEQLVQSHPDFALVEDDLQRYDPKNATALVQQFTREHAEIDHQLQETFEQVGTIKQELKQLESDRRGIRVRRELAQLDDDLRDAWESWMAAALAEDGIHDVAGQFERANQPEMLAAAKPFLHRLTLSKYNHLWAPLGRKQLFVDDDKGESRPAERLSGGTREQLFLSIRLAMVKAFAKNGIDLPMVLDDVTVNFDQERSEAAVQTFIDFTNDGQQLLVFTSHLHFAQLFEKHGVQPIYLPARRASGVISEERLAG